MKKLFTMALALLFLTAAAGSALAGTKHRPHPKGKHHKRAMVGHSTVQSS
jgi:hypothetical protein